MPADPARWRGALILALGATVAFLEVFRPHPHVPWIGLALVGLAMATGTTRQDENGVMQPRLWQTALLLICTVVIGAVMMGRELGRWD